MKFFDCADKCFSVEEYRTLKNEQSMRTKMVFTNGFTLVGIVLVFWAAIFAFCKDLLDLITAEGSLIGKSAIIDCIIALAIIFFCSVPTILAFAFSVKYRDNIRQIVNIANFIKVFYEYPTMIKENSENAVKDDLFGWETLHSIRDNGKEKFTAVEYAVISIGSLILTLIFGIALFSCLLGLKLVHKEHKYIENSGLSTAIS